MNFYGKRMLIVTNKVSQSKGVTTKYLPEFHFLFIYLPTNAVNIIIMNRNNIIDRLFEIRCGCSMFVYIVI